MAEVLLIERADIVKYTPLDGNVDTDKFIQFVKIAQDIHIPGYLGTDLLNKLKAEIEAGTLADPYLSLLTTYIKPMLIHWSMVEYLPYAAYTVANKGVYKHTAESSTDVSKSEINNKSVVSKFAAFAVNSLIFFVAIFLSFVFC